MNYQQLAMEFEEWENLGVAKEISKLRGRLAIIMSDNDDYYDMEQPVDDIDVKNYSKEDAQEALILIEQIKDLERYYK